MTINPRISITVIIFYWKYPSFYINAHHTRLSTGLNRPNAGTNKHLNKHVIERHARANVENQAPLWRTIRRTKG